MIRHDDKDSQARQDLIRRAKARIEEKGRRGLRKTPPRPRRPEQEIRRYRASLRDIRRAMERQIRDEVFPQIDSIIREAGLRDDAVRADDWSARIADLFAATRSAVEPAEQEARRRMETLGDQVREHATDEQVRQVRAVMGVAPSFYDDEVVGGLLNEWKRRNGAFITQFSNGEIEEAQAVVSRAVRNGRATEDVKNDLRKRFRISDNRAERIARTEISQLNSQITRERQRELGVEKFIWITAQDERVRDQHEEWAGREFEWDNPPDGVLPGEPVNCRCTSRMAVEGLLDDLEAEE